MLRLRGGRRYRTKCGKDPQARSSIRLWRKKFMETGSVLDTVRSWRPRTSAENIESVRQAFSRSLTKSIRTAARELELPIIAVHKVLRTGPPRGRGAEGVNDPGAHEP